MDFLFWRLILPSSHLRLSEASPYALGLDIGNYAIKAIVLKQTAEGYAVCYANRILNRESDTVDGTVDSRDLTARLRPLLKEAGLPLTSASFSLPTEHAQIRWIDLPQMTPDALRAATKFEARKYLPYSVDEAEVQILPMQQSGDQDDGKMRALMIAAPRKLITGRAEALEAAGLEITHTEVETFPLLRAQKPMERAVSVLWGGQPLTHVHLGHQASSMSVAQGVDVRFMRAISWGSSRLSQTLAGALAIGADEARTILEGPSSQLDGMGNLTWTEAGEPRQTDALIGELERLYREIQRLLNYYRSLFPERSYEGILDRIYLSGGAAGLHGLEDYFSRALQFSVTISNPFQLVTLQLSPESFAAVTGQRAAFGVAVGLAMGALEMGRYAEARSGQRTREYVWRRKAA